VKEKEWRVRKFQEYTVVVSKDTTTPLVKVKGPIVDLGHRIRMQCAADIRDLLNDKGRKAWLNDLVMFSAVRAGDIDGTEISVGGPYVLGNIESQSPESKRSRQELMKKIMGI